MLLLGIYAHQRLSFFEKFAGRRAIRHDIHDMAWLYRIGGRPRSRTSATSTNHRFIYVKE